MRPNETALFIDGPNVYLTAKALGFDVDYKRLHNYFSARCDLIRAYYYTAVRERDTHDSLRPLLDWLDYNQYTLVQKPTKEWTDASGRTKVKGNMDMEMACDAFDLSSTIRNATFFTGDGDFVAIIRLLQRRGIRCTVVSSTETQPVMCADELRRAADEFVELSELNKAIYLPTPTLVRKESRYA